MELEPRTSAPAHATGAVAFVDLDEIAEDATFRLREEGDVSLLAGSIGRLGQLVPIELRPWPGAGPEEEGGPQLQVVAGFRRLAALKLLFRDRVLARIHDELGDEDAWGLALVQPLLTEPLDAAGLAALRDRLPEARAEGWAEELLAEALVRAPIDAGLREQFYAWLNGEAEVPAAPGAAPDEDGLEVAADPDAAPAPELEQAAAASVADLEPVAVAPPPPATGPAAPDPASPLEVTPLEVTPEELVADLERRLYEVNADLAVAVEAWADLPPAGRRAIAAQARWIAEVLPLLEGGPGGEDDR